MKGIKERIAERLSGIHGGIGGMSIVDLSLRLTLLDMLLRPVGDRTVRPLTLAFAALGLLIPGQLRSRLIWLPLAFLTGLRVLLDWPLPDNHAYLLFYWCLAVTIALFSRDSERCLAFNGKFLIGLAFAFALLWKAFLSGDFMDCRFFSIAMLTDPRFEAFTRSVLSLDDYEIDSLTLFVEQHIDGELPVQGLDIPSLPSKLHLVSEILTYWTVLIESAVAILFLMPARAGVSRLRDAFLILFCATTYSVATVEGFGWLLIAMGVSQSGERREAVRYLYVAAFLLILVYSYLPMFR
ncbi:MAG: hypothetical protein L0213_14900 [Candidatus Dadabacteria bacterium]|nr:hypothetical protein [Candidatus Dadabacteria bacterium]